MGPPILRADFEGFSVLAENAHIYGAIGPISKTGMDLKGAERRSGARMWANVSVGDFESHTKGIGQRWRVMIPVGLMARLPPSSLGAMFGRNGETLPFSIRQITNEIDAGNPVVVLTCVTASFYRPDARGLIDPAKGEIQSSNIRHAVLGIGHGTVEGQAAILIRNSWGPKWGQGGYAWLTESYLGPRGYAAAVLKEEIDVSTNKAAA